MLVILCKPWIEVNDGLLESLRPPTIEVIEDNGDKSDMSLPLICNEPVNTVQPG